MFNRSDLKLKTKFKLLFFMMIDMFVDFLFKVKILRIRDDVKNEILKEVREKEASFIGGKDKFELREIRVEIINGCNTTCIMCPREIQTRKAGKMKIDLYRDLIKEAHDLGATALYPYHMGESLILKDFCEYIKIAKEIGYETIMLTTTGGLIEQYNLEELVTSGLTIINFSLDAIKQSTYEKIRTNMKLEVIENSIRKIIEVRNRLNIDLEVSVKFMHFPGINDGEWPVFKKRWDGVADRVYYTVVHDWGKRTNLNAHVKFEPQEYCRYLRQKLIFGWDGTAMFCCMDYDNIYPIGKYPEQSLKEIMNSPRLLEARRLHYEGKLGEHHMCKQCYMTLDEAVVYSYKKKFKKNFINFTDQVRGKRVDI